MLLDMEHHSALLSLNMSPFNLSPGAGGGGTQGGGGGGGTQGGGAGVTAALTPSSLAPPSLYGSPPLTGWQSQPQQQHQQQQQHHQQQHHQQQHHQGHGSMLMSNLDACLFPGADYPASAVRPDLPDTKEGIEELCPVCGDKVSGYHYGLLTCESCKGFFKRTVQNKKVYTCVADRSCHIDKTQRKRCPFCRFQKCLEVGMKLEAVRADRMRGGRNKFGPMYKRDRARKLQMMRQRQIAVQTIRGGHSGGHGGHSGHSGHSNLSQSGQSSQGLSDLPYPSQSAAQSFSLHIKQEIQIPQVSSLTSSPDSSPSPIAVALGQASASASGGVSGPPGLQLAAPTTAPSSTPASAATNLAANSEHKLWGGSTGGGTGGGGGGGGGGGTPSRDLLDGLMGSTSPTTSKMTPMMRDLVQSVDDREWQNSLFGLLQNQTYNQCEVDLFELMCKVLDQNLFSQVDWARNSCFFKDLKVDDQMKLLQYSWSDMLVLDHLHQRLHNQLPDETTLPNGQKFDLLCLGLLGVASLADQFGALAHQFALLKFDVSDYICLKFLLLLNPDVRGIMNRKHVQEGHNQVKTALHDYTSLNYPQIQDKFNRLLMLLPDIHEMAARGEDHLYQKHCSGGAPTQTLLMEMLHAKRK